jgi:hypothetical protein
MARKKRDERKERSFFDTYWFEITVLGLLGLGIFLLLEELEIKAMVYDFMVRNGRGVLTYIRSTGRSVWEWIRQVKTSNMVGFSLIVMAIVLVAAKLRHRAFKRHAHITACPVCGADLYRIRCRFVHRLLELVLWLRITHYACCKCSFRTTVWRRRGER